jgi:hypothetical protein
MTDFAAAIIAATITAVLTRFINGTCSFKVAA